jgi:hypothetical protein
VQGLADHSEVRAARSYDSEVVATFGSIIRRDLFWLVLPPKRKKEKKKNPTANAMIASTMLFRSPALLSRRGGRLLVTKSTTTTTTTRGIASGGGNSSIGHQEPPLLPQQRQQLQQRRGLAFQKSFVSSEYWLSHSLIAPRITTLCANCSNIAIRVFWMMIALYIGPF